MRNTGKHIAQTGGLHESRKEANKLFSAQICTGSSKDQPNSDAMANLTQHTSIIPSWRIINTKKRLYIMPLTNQGLDLIYTVTV